jgi:hypothetical protein
MRGTGIRVAAGGGDFQANELTILEFDGFEALVAFEDRFGLAILARALVTRLRFDAFALHENPARLAAVALGAAVAFVALARNHASVVYAGGLRRTRALRAFLVRSTRLAVAMVPGFTEGAIVPPVAVVARADRKPGVVVTRAGLVAGARPTRLVCDTGPVFFVEPGSAGVAIVAAVAATAGAIDLAENDLAGRVVRTGVFRTSFVANAAAALLVVATRAVGAVVTRVARIAVATDEAIGVVTGSVLTARVVVTALGGGRAFAILLGEAGRTFVA